MCSTLIEWVVYIPTFIFPPGLPTPLQPGFTVGTWHGLSVWSSHGHSGFHAAKPSECTLVRIFMTYSSIWQHSKFFLGETHPLAPLVCLPSRCCFGLLTFWSLSFGKRASLLLLETPSLPCGLAVKQLVSLRDPPPALGWFKYLAKKEHSSPPLTSSLGKMLAMHILRPHSRLTAWETQVGLSSLYKLSWRFWSTSKFEN